MPGHWRTDRSAKGLRCVRRGCATASAGTGMSRNKFVNRPYKPILHHRRRRCPLPGLRNTSGSHRAFRIPVVALSRATVPVNAECRRRRPTARQCGVAGLPDSPFPMRPRVLPLPRWPATPARYLPNGAPGPQSTAASPLIRPRTIRRAATSCEGSLTGNATQYCCVPSRYPTAGNRTFRRPTMGLK